MKVLKARVYEAQMKEQLAQNAEARKMQVGTGDRSEKIRTYNYPQGRITDHRIGLTIYALDDVMNNGALDLIINPLIAHAQAEALKGNEES